MIEESGRVVAIEGDFAWVETARKSSCSSCSTQGCGTGVLAEVLGARVQRLKVRNELHASSGEQVLLGIDESALLRGSLAVYIAPLLALFVGALLGETLFVSDGELPALLGGLLGLALGLLWLRRFNRKVSYDPRYQARMLRRQTMSAETPIQPMSSSEE